MTFMTNYPTGIDCVWIAEDARNMLAAFITAGLGPIPKTVIEDGDDLIQEIEGALMQLPVISGACMHIDVPRPDDFISLAERGVYVYDWREMPCNLSGNKSSYVRVASPKKSALNVGIYLDLTRSLRFVQMKNVIFENSECLDDSFVDEAVFPMDC